MSPQLQDTLGMFFFLAVELSALFIGISLLVGVLQRNIPLSKVEVLLSSNRRRGYLLAAGLGAITPFCSCSTIPMLKGLIRARAGFGPMMVFLFSSPLLNPIIVGLLVATFGLTLTAVYVLAALAVAIGAGWLLHKLDFKRYIRRTAAQEHTECSSAGQADKSSSCDNTASCCTAPKTSSCSNEKKSDTTPGNCCDAQPTATAKKDGKYSGLWREAWSDFVEVLPYLFIGIAIGSVIYGFMPTSLLEKYAGPDNPFAIPIAAVIGVPAIHSR